MQKKRYMKVVLDLFDGEAGTAAADNGANGSGSETAGTVISPEAQRRGRELGLSDDLMEDYQKAFGGESEHPEAENAEDDTQDDTQEEEHGENAEEEFRELISGRYKDEFQKRMSAAVKDRLQKANAEKQELIKQLKQSSKVLDMLKAKYGDLDPNDPDALYKAVREDGDIWRQRAIDAGGSIEDAVEAFDSEQQKNAEHEELERYRREDAARQLDMRLQGIAAETAKKYPDFDLQKEFENPRFRTALDFVAKSNTDRNRETGRNDEIYDLTYAYELAHADELRENVIKRTSRATASAMAQTIAANRGRVKENAASSSATGKPKSISELSDKEFDELVRNVKSRKAFIP